MNVLHGYIQWIRDIAIQWPFNFIFWYKDMSTTPRTMKVQIQDTKDFIPWCKTMFLKTRRLYLPPVHIPEDEQPVGNFTKCGKCNFCHKLWRHNNLSFEVSTLRSILDLQIFVKTIAGPCCKLIPTKARNLQLRMPFLTDSWSSNKL